MLLVIEGRVQGVWYRASAQREAARLGLSGWVRNRPDGSVELLAEGPDPALEALRIWCGHGPPAAQVETVRAEFSAASGEHHGFRVTD